MVQIKSYLNSVDKIAIIGLGYVGLPLAVELGKIREVIGFDLNKKRIEELKNFLDTTKEVESEALKEAKHLSVTSSSADIADANVFIVTVPTPIEKENNPDLKPLILASETVGKYLKKGDKVIYESTVYPGCTEEVCVPIIEKYSGLNFNEDFFCGYSPERVNPGDKTHRLPNIKKVTSGSTPEMANYVDKLYRQIIIAGTYKANSIKVAEAAKVIENTQRDLNIAFINELAVIFDKMNIDTHEVLEAAGTKWNFLPFKPGLVGGHCIGVDPYYLTYKAKQLGYHPEVILAGRRINDNMPMFVANKVVKMMSNKDIIINKSKALILGVTFKENCPDIRNSKVINLINELVGFGIKVDAYDPIANPEEVRSVYNVNMITTLTSTYDLIVLAVNHASFENLDLVTLKKGKCVVFDIKGNLNRDLIDDRL